MTLVSLSQKRNYKKLVFNIFLTLKHKLSVYSHSSITSHIDLSVWFVSPQITDAEFDKQMGLEDDRPVVEEMTK